MKTIDLIMKATRRCNLRCEYCGDWRARGDNAMSFATVARVTEHALRDYDCVQFTWHGGETTLLPISFYKKAMLAQARLRRPGQIVVNSLQTNGTLIDDEWACFFRDARFDIGVSIDGPPDVQNKMRPYASGKGSFDDVVRGIEALRRRGVPHGVIMVVDHAVLDAGPARIFDFFVDLGVSSYSCLPVKPVERPDGAHAAVHHTSVRRMTEFLRGLYDCWLAHGDPDIHVVELDAVRNRLRGEDPGSCTMGGTCFGKYFTVEPNGDVKNCDCFQEPEALGNIATRSFADIASSDAILARIAANERELRVVAEQCAHFEITRGGCAHERQLAAAREDAADRTCCAPGGLIDYIRSKMTQEHQMIAAATGEPAVQPPVAEAAG